MDQRCRILVVGSDTIRAERLTRDLRNRLAEIPDVHTELGRSAAGLDTADRTGADRKGGVGDLGVWVGFAAPLAPVLIAAIKEWCGRDRHRRLEIVSDDRKVVLDGAPTEAMERVVHEFLNVSGNATDATTGEQK